MPYTNGEYANMHLMYGLAEGNALEAQRLYQDHFPQRQLPNQQTIQAVDRRLREGGKTQPAGRGAIAQDAPEVVEGKVLTIFEDDDATSTRKAGRQLGVTHVLVWRILRGHPYHLHKVKALNETDYPRRLDFCQWFMATKPPRY